MLERLDLPPEQNRSLQSAAFIYKESNSHNPGVQPRESPLYSNFLKRMAELGYQEGRNFTFDYIQTSDIEGYEKNYRELAAHKVDVFLAVKRAGAACRAFGRGR